jgi:hypothetical protein
LIRGIGYLDPVANIKDRPMRDPSDVYLARADADGYAVVQMAANRFVVNEAKDAGRMATGTVLIVAAGWTSQ